MFVRETTRIRPIRDFYDGNKRVNLIYIANNLPKNKRIDIKYHKISMEFTYRLKNGRKNVVEGGAIICTLRRPYIKNRHL